LETGRQIGAALASLLNGYAPMFIALGGLGALAAIISLVGIPNHQQGDQNLLAATTHE
jgi:hypothetical protein